MTWRAEKSLNTSIRINGYTTHINPKFSNTGTRANYYTTILSKCLMVLRHNSITTCAIKHTHLTGLARNLGMLFIFSLVFSSQRTKTAIWWQAWATHIVSGPFSAALSPEQNKTHISWHLRNLVCYIWHGQTTTLHRSYPLTYKCTTLVCLLHYTKPNVKLDCHNTTQRISWLIMGTLWSVIKVMDFEVKGLRFKISYIESYIPYIKEKKNVTVFLHLLLNHTCIIHLKSQFLAAKHHNNSTK